MSPIHRFWSYGLAVLGLAAVSGCREHAVQAAGFPVVVQALDELGKPLPGLQLSAAGASLGETDAQGRKALELPGVEGQRVDLVASCPENYAGPRERPAFLLKRMRDASGNLSDQPIDVTVTCEAKNHVALVAVQTGQAGLPIMLRGQVVAQTSDLGSAHVMLREPVGNSFQLTLDTTARPELRPESPTRLFTVTRQDAFSVWDQPFELEKRASGAAARKRRKARGGVATPPSPQASRRSRQ